MVRDKSGRQPRLVGVSSDITDRKASDEALTRLNEMLEERVAARTAELTEAHAAVLAEIKQRERAEEQLRQAQKMEMIGQLTGGVAHDFNNLLMAVQSNLDLLRKHVPDDPRTARLINGALQGAQRGAALTQRLLAFARRQDLKLEPSDLTDLLRGAVDLIIEANSADSALQILRGNPAVDLLVTDYSMPRMNGAQLAAAARQIRPELPILLAAGYAELPVGSGMGLPRIGKPYHQDQLAAEITKVLKSRRC